ncbi:MAG TPA: hypothetical protein VLA24_00165 [Pseudomonadales bacterium]|nr:hypothetical protein [Pseudomonadales bacterium]
MSHVRKQIRDAIVTAVTGLSTTGSRVYKTRLYPLEQGKLPGICVYTKAEESTPITITKPRTIERTLEVMLESYTLAGDDGLDQICLEVEEAIYNDSALNALIKDVYMSSFEADFNGDGEKPVATGRLTVVCQYITAENDVETSA